MVSGAHQAVVAEAGALLRIAVSGAVVVEVGPAAEHMAALMAEGAYAQVLLAPAKAGEHIEVGLHAAAL